MRNKLAKKEFFRRCMLNSKQKVITLTAGLSAFAFPAFAEGGGGTLTFNFDPAEMFTWTNTMLSALMPVLYITLGISLAFIIINALKYAFR